MATDNAVKMRVGTGIIDVLSKTFYTKKRMIFDELVTNAYDAGATRVDLHFGKDEISIVDNGNGMAREQLERFFSIAETTKVEGGEIRVGKRKRKTIGKFGIGKLSMRQICNKFLIRSSTDGKTTYESELDFSRLQEFRYIEDIELKVYESEEKIKRGTQLILSQLIEITDELLKEVRVGLSRTMPLSEDFEVYINGKKIEQFDYVQIYKPEQKDIDEEDKDLGRIYGKIFFTEKPMRDDEVGIFIRVNRRIVNADNGRIIDFARLNHPQYLGRRILCDLNVDSLEPAILANRSGFFSDNILYVKFIAWIRAKLRKTGEVVWEKHQKETREKQEDSIREKLLPSVKDAAIEMSKALQIESPDFWKKLKLVVEEKTEDDPECMFLSEKSLLVFNSAHPAFIFAREKNQLEIHCLKAAAMILAIFFTQIKMKTSLTEFNENYEHLLRRMGEGDEAVVQALYQSGIEDIDAAREALSASILTIMEDINLRLGKIVFDIPISDAPTLQKECEDKEEFNFAVQKLYSWIEKMDTSYFEKFLGGDVFEAGKKKRSIRLVEDYLSAKGIDKDHAQILRHLEKISAGIARHTNAELKKDLGVIYKHYGFDTLTAHYETFWVLLLHEFEKFIVLLNNTITK
jgi:hypothetical protein